MKKLFWNNQPLAVKLTIMITAVLIIVVVGVTLLYTRRLQGALRDDLERQADFALDTLSVAVVNPILKVDVETLQDYAVDLGEQPLVRLVRIVDDQGRVLADAHDPNLVLRQEIDPFGQKALASDTIIFDWRSDRLVAGKAVIIGHQRVGAVTLELSTQIIEEKLAATRAEGIITVVLAILVGAIVAALFIRGVIDPLQELLKASRQIAGGDFSAQALVTSKDEVGQLATAFNSMTARLKDLFETLEERVADRTKALATSSEVSRRLSTILNERQLVIEVVGQISNAFDYYHAHIYILDEFTGDLIMAGGTGKAGQTMLARGHKVLRGKGLVGRAAETNLPVLVSDVSSDPDWLPNPLLPETKSEIAVPISAAGKVLGVLDVQHNVPGGLRQEDADLLQSIANQVAIAIQNARAYKQAQVEAKKETLINTINEKIQRATTIETVLQIAARELSRLTGVKQATVQLGALELRVNSKSVDHSDGQPQN